MKLLIQFVSHRLKPCWTASFYVVNAYRWLTDWLAGLLVHTHVTRMSWLISVWTVLFLFLFDFDNRRLWRSLVLYWQSTITALLLLLRLHTNGWVGNWNLVLAQRGNYFVHRNTITSKRAKVYAVMSAKTTNDTLQMAFVNCPFVPDAAADVDRHPVTGWCNGSRLHTSSPFGYGGRMSML